MLYQQLENYLIAPRVMRGAVKLSPAAVLLVGLIGGAALGLIGALMAIPVAAGVTVLLSEHFQAGDAADNTTAADEDDVTAARPEQHAHKGMTAGHASRMKCQLSPPGRNRALGACRSRRRLLPQPKQAIGSA